MTHLLLVDDDEEDLKLFSLILENYHYTVDTYSDPILALLEFEPNFYDLIILDYLMSGLNGMELYREIKEIDNCAKIIFLTASIDQFYVNDKDLHSEIIRKPVRMGEFLRDIKSALTSQVKSEFAASQTDPISI